jgi:hypothetical protein
VKEAITQGRNAMTESRVRKAGALVRAETLQADALALLGYCSLFASVIGVLLAMHGL